MPNVTFVKLVLGWRRGAAGQCCDIKEFNQKCPFWEIVTTISCVPWIICLLVEIYFLTGEGLTVQKPQDENDMD